MPGIFCFKEAKAVGLSEAVKDCGLSRVILEFDAKIIVDAF